MPSIVAAQDILRVPGKHIVRLTYICEIDGDVKLDLDENSEYKWLDLKDIMSMDNVDKYFKDILNKNIIK